MPFTPSALVLDCFELARDIRTLDMRASPYDLAALGYPAGAIETPQAKPSTPPPNAPSPTAPARSAEQLVALCDKLLG